MARRDPTRVAGCETLTGPDLKAFNSFEKTAQVAPRALDPPKAESENDVQTAAALYTVARIAIRSPTARGYCQVGSGQKVMLLKREESLPRCHESGRLHRGPKGEADWIIMDPEIDFGAIFKQFERSL